MNKPEARRHWRQQRRLAMAALGPSISEQVRACLGELQRPGHLGLFWPLGSEPDLLKPTPTWPGGLALPRCEPSGLVYAHWRVDDVLAADDCGIPAPQGPPLAAEAIGLLLIPALAMGPAGQRLGSGGGWYDRLRAQSAWRQVPTLAVLPERCCGVDFAGDAWDVPLQGWISEAGLHWCNGAQC